MTRRNGVGGSARSAKRKLRAMGDTLTDTLQFRRALEPSAAQLAAERADTVDTAHLTVMVDNAVRAAQDEYRAHDLRLHVAIADLGGSPSLVDAIAKLQTQLSDLLGAFPTVAASIHHSDQQHQQIVAAIQERENRPRARHCMEGARRPRPRT